ncbi:MAG: methyltransferase domain-containing protein [Candidatus Gastranaerophilales bacterium]|nr:methyltransferase domain-containing protein [Candidatus Gastranaerophilales bacterium]
MNLDGIVLQNYIYHFLREMDNNYSFAGKTVMFLHTTPVLDNSRAILKLGAEKVYFVNAEFKHQTEENGKITALNEKTLNLIEDNSVDLILGLEILEHINNLKNFFSEIKRVLKKGGKAELRGYPVWTNPLGHHIWLTGKYIYYEDTNPFKPWEHLTYSDKTETRNALLQKGINEDDAYEIARWIYDKTEISRHTPTEIIKAATNRNREKADGGINYTRYGIFEEYKLKNFAITAKRTCNRFKENEFFELAKEKYNEDDLKTDVLTITLSKE